MFLNLKVTTMIWWVSKNWYGSSFKFWNLL